MSMLTELLQVLRAPQRFKATYRDGEVYVETDAGASASADGKRVRPRRAATR
jgi:hypothetical protein